MGGGAWAAVTGLIGVKAIQMRPARAEDIDAIHAIEVASFSDPWKRHGFRDLILAGNAIVVVAEQANTIVGFAVSYSGADEAEIANVAVAMSARRTGIGRALVEHVISASSAIGATRVFLEVRESNVAARALYGARGFVELSRRRAYYTDPREDAVVMRLDLSHAVI